MCNALHEELKETISTEVNILQEVVAQVKEETFEKVRNLETRISS